MTSTARDQLLRLVRGWQSCTPLTLDIKIKALASYGLFNGLPDDIWQAYVAMKDRRDELRASQ